MNSNEKEEALLNILSEELKSTVYKRIETCLENEEYSIKGRIKWNYGCGNRYCPVCSKKWKNRVVRNMNKKLESTEYNNYLFMLLNGRNVSIDNLEKEIESNNKAFTKMLGTKKIKAITKGYIKVLEIAYIEESKTFLPHLHVVLIVKNSYRKYFQIKSDKEEIKESWEYFKNQENLFVDIQSVRDINKVIGYLTVSNKKRLINLVEYESDVIRAYIRATRNKKIYTYGGVVSDKKKDFQKKDLANKDVLNITYIQ